MGAIIHCLRGSVRSSPYLPPLAMTHNAFIKSTLATAAALVLAAASHAQITISATNSTPGIFDASSGTRDFTFSAADLGFSNHSILDVDISINFAKADGQGVTLGTGTPYLNETGFTLSYAANSVGLITPGSFLTGSVPFSGVIDFDDAAALVVNSNPEAMTAGTFKPVGLLSTFNGLVLLPGTWTLSIVDTAGADALRFYDATLSVTYATPSNPVPEPSTYGLIGAGVLVALGLLRRLRRRQG